VRYRKCNEPPKGLRQIVRCIDGQAEAVRESILVRVSNDEYRQLTERCERSGASLSRMSRSRISVQIPVTQLEAAS
jgi:hypothetical protein